MFQGVTLSYDVEVPQSNETDVVFVVDDVELCFPVTEVKPNDTLNATVWVTDLLTGNDFPVG